MHDSDLFGDDVRPVDIIMPRRSWPEHDCHGCCPCPDGGGGIAGRPMTQGWLCPQCGTVNAPGVLICMSCAPQRPLTATPDCGCPDNTVCMNTACPRRVKITSSSGE